MSEQSDAFEVYSQLFSTDLIRRTLSESFANLTFRTFARNSEFSRSTRYKALILLGLGDF